MLKFLTVKNYALIRHVELEFNDGFTVITGETGAGKSILLGALDLIRGKRADMKILLDKNKKCFVEGTFSIKGNALKPLFEHYDLDWEDYTVLRRELTSYGKSRAFINDTPVTLGVLAEISARLMDIHAQEETSSLNNPAFQFQVIDGFSGLTDEMNGYRTQFEKLSDLKKEYEQLQFELEKVKSEQDYIAFVLDEMERAELKEGEQEQLEKELKVLEHAEEIRTVLFQTVQMLDNENGGILDHLRKIIQMFQKVSDFDTGLEELQHRLDTTQVDLFDLHREIEKYDPQVMVAPRRTETVHERLSP
jgi:DNA repair protein RecN (Recombination protein N)